MAVQSVLVEYFEDKDLFTSSGLLFDKRWVFVPAASLLISLSEKTKIPEELENLETSKICETNHMKLSSENFRVITTSESSKNAQSIPVRYVAVFSCKNIKDTVDFPLTCVESNNNQNNVDFNSLLSLFFIFEINFKIDFDRKSLFASINNLLRSCQSAQTNRGSFICIESTPFGTRDLLASYSQGIICNSVGKNNCFILVDAATAPGSEGAPIYSIRGNNVNSPKMPVGIVISSLNWWRGEHTGLTLGATLEPLLSQLVPEKWTFRNFLFSKKHEMMGLADKSIVQVFCGNGWGTGILIDKINGVFITGSHVVKSADSEPIILKWKGKNVPAILIYRTINSPVFDIAVIRCASKSIEQMTPIKFASSSAVKGENVLAVGFPIFNSQDSVYYPVITKGNISLVDDCIFHTTCCVLPGSSGGSILRTNGELLGIIVCHTTVTLKNEFVVYPKINMAIPISAIYKPLKEYIKNNDAASLKVLENYDTDVVNKWHLFRGKL